MSKTKAQIEQAPPKPMRGTTAGAPEQAAPGKAGGPGRAQMAATQRKGGNARVQAKTAVGAPGDRHEQEADAVAGRVVSGQKVARIPRLAESGQPPAAGRGGGPAKREEKHAMPHSLQAQAKPPGGGEVEDTALESRLKAPGAGRPVPEGIRREAEAGLGEDLSAVRVHDAAEDKAMAKSLDAKAFTYGQDVFMGPGGSAGDRKLMAHELTHVVQQRTRPTLQREGEPQAEPAGTEGKTWLDILPKRTPKKGWKSSLAYHNQPGHAPSVSYEDARADTQESGASPEEIDAAVAQIVETRGRIPDRGFHRDFAAGNKGNVYYLEGQYGKISGTKQYGMTHVDTSAEAARYRAWAAGGTLPSEKAGFKPERDMDKWRLFQAMAQMEGKATTVTAGAVDTTVTLGPGISSGGGGAQRVLDTVFSRSAEIQASALAAGLQIAGSGKAKRFVVADTEKKCILDGPDAEKYIAASPPLLSFIANITLGAQGSLASGAGPAVETDEAKSAEQRQAMMDAQWVEIFSSTFKGFDASSVASWKNMASKVLAVHAHHAWAPYSLNWDWATTEDTEGLVRIIYRLGPKNAHLICNGEPYRSILAKVKAEEKSARQAAARPKERSEMGDALKFNPEPFVAYKVDFRTGRLVGVMADGRQVFTDEPSASGE